MDIQKFNTVPVAGETVLVAPLDWGLGHVTRCIPIVRALLKRGNSVIIAANGGGKALLTAEFPGVPVIGIPDYNVRLPAAGRMTAIRLLAEIPRLWSVVKKERQWLEALCTAHRIGLVISDNRYGLFSSRVHTVFITHQLYIRSGLGDAFDRLLTKIHFRLIGRFIECWVPDVPAADLSLAGRLSHPSRKPVFPVTYLGLLSRFSVMPVRDRKQNPGDHLLVMLSGPEPQRSLLEKAILKQLHNYEGPVLLVRGMPGTAAGEATGPAAGDPPAGRHRPDLQIVNHLPAAALGEAIQNAGVIICRSGYSTLMDLIALHRVAILIPTPGQPEQEYLARRMDEQGRMIAVQQEKFSLGEALGKMRERNADGVTPTPASASAGLFFFNGDLPALTLR